VTPLPLELTPSALGGRRWAAHAGMFASYATVLDRRGPGIAAAIEATAVPRQRCGVQEVVG